MKNAVLWDVAPCGFIRTDVSEECVAFIFRVDRISDLGTLAANSKLLSTDGGETFSETSVLTRPTQGSISEDSVLYLCYLQVCLTQVEYWGNSSLKNMFSLLCRGVGLEARRAAEIPLIPFYLFIVDLRACFDLPGLCHPP
jgi:hypothetical protein